MEFCNKCLGPEIVSPVQLHSYTRAWAWAWAWAQASELNSNFNYANYSTCNSHTCQVCLFDMAFQKQSKGRQQTIFDCLDVNQSDSSASKRQRQQPSDETDEQEMQLVSNDIRTTNDSFNSVCTSVTAVLGGVPDDIAVSSVKLDACFCYPCRLFGSNGGGSSSRGICYDRVQKLEACHWEKWKFGSP